MRRDHRPFWLRQLDDRFQTWWQKRYLEPQFDKCGDGLYVPKPWNIEVIGSRIELGRDVHLNSTPVHKILLCTWQDHGLSGRIDIGDFALISPGVQITSGQEIIVGRNSMIATDVIISDCDWHEIYDRATISLNTRPVVLEENVWLGARTIVTKGQRIGRNSIIGAGSVVASNIPANVIAAGNPARVVKELDPDMPMRMREDLLKDRDGLNRLNTALYQEMLGPNSLLHWLRTKTFRKNTD